MIPRTRDTARGYGSRQRAPAVGTLAHESPGTGHVSPGMNTRFCAICLCNRPSKGGRERGPLYLCGLHPEKSSVPA